MKKINRKWTQEELDYLKDNYSVLGPTKILKVLTNRTFQTVTQKAQQLGLSRCELWTDEEVDILKENYSKLGPKKMKVMLPHRTIHGIRTKAKKLGLSYKQEVNWTDEELDILRKYYPSEGSKVAKRLNNRSKGSILVTAQYYGIKFDKVCKEWTIEEDEVIYEFCLKHKESSFNRISELLQELSDNGFTEHGAKSVYMRLHNFSYLETGYGFSHASKQSKAVYNKNNKKVD